MTQFWTIAKGAAALRSRQVKVTQLVEACLAQIDQREAELQAWVLVLAAEARQQAADCDRWRAQQPVNFIPPSPLWGIPLGIKDIIDIAGLPSRCGSRTLADAPPAMADAPVVAALRSHGAIFFGKTVTTEFACFDPAPTRNPHNVMHTPGGSSSGSAAAVASGMCLAAVGTQTGGSILRPAAYCGLVGHKPPHGKLPLTGIFPVSPRLDHVGPLTQTVEDAWLMLHAMQASTKPLGPIPEIPRTPLSKLRLATWDGFFAEQACEEMNGIFGNALLCIRQENPSLSSLNLSKGQAVELISTALLASKVIMSHDAWQVHAARFRTTPELLGPNLQGFLKLGAAVSPADYAQAVAVQASFRQEVGQLIAPYDAILLPTTPASAPASLETTGDPRFSAPWSLAGFPAITVPMGNDASGMPCGLQLIGVDEERLFAAAFAIEAALAKL